MQNEYAQIAPATIALQEAVKQLNSVKKEYEQYKNEKSNLQTKLNELKQRYKNKEAGINASDIEDLSDILDNIKDEERYYITNVALATTNVASKTTALISQIAAASVSSGTYGFSVGVAANISGTQTNTKNKQTISSPSNLNALNIRLTTNKDKDTSTNITGSNLLANNNIDIDTKDLNINSSQDRFESDENSKSLSGSAKFNMYGGGGGSLGLDHSQSNSYSESIINNNSKLISNKDININTANDTTIKGANLRADGTLNLKVGNNLSLESLRDRYTSNQKDFSISAGVGFSGNTIAKSNGITTTGLFDKNHFTDINTIDKSSTNANFSRSRSNTITKQTILSSITANELNVEVAKNTHLKGSLLAAGEYDKDNTFIDNHNLNLKTNTLSYENLSNTSYNKGSSLSIGANYSVGKKEVANFTQDDYRPQNMQNTLDIAKNEKANSRNNPNISNISLGTSNSVILSKTLATIGNGNLQIANLDKSDDLERLNRNVKNIQKDIVNSQTGTYTNADIDIRLFSQNGREAIKHDLLIMADSLSNDMPKENSDNIVEANIAKSLNFLGDITLGIIPSNKNKGGILGQLGATIVAEPNFKVLGDKNSNNVFIPGIMTKEESAKYQAKFMIAPKEYNYEDTFAYSNYKIYYNPTRGLIADLVESAVDLFGGTSEIAKQTGYEMKNNPNNHYVALSQGSLIANSAINYYGLNQNLVYIGTPLYTEPNNGITINSKNDVIHDPTNIFNIPLYKNGQIFYEHIWSNQYKGVIENIKIKEQ